MSPRFESREDKAWEDRARVVVARHFGMNVVKTPDLERHDWEVRTGSGLRVAVFEYKGRKYDMDFLDSQGGVYLSVEKYDHLRGIADAEGAAAFFVVGCTDGCYYTTVRPALACRVEHSRRSDVRQPQDNEVCYLIAKSEFHLIPSGDKS